MFRSSLTVWNTFDVILRTRVNDKIRFKWFVAIFLASSTPFICRINRFFFFILFGFRAMECFFGNRQHQHFQYWVISVDNEKRQLRVDREPKIVLFFFFISFRTEWKIRITDRLINESAWMGFSGGCYYSIYFAICCCLRSQQDAIIQMFFQPLSFGRRSNSTACMERWRKQDFFEISFKTEESVDSENWQIN